MKAFVNRFVIAMPLLVLCVAFGMGCGGSSPSTSRAEALAVARAEHVFDTSWRQASLRGQERCKGKATDAAATRCFGAAVAPGEAAAEMGFFLAMEKVLESGVGGECEKALEAALAEVSQIALFPGEATRACRKESEDK